MTTQQTIGFIGFGAMASRMAAHLEKLDTPLLPIRLLARVVMA